MKRLSIILLSLFFAFSAVFAQEDAEKFAVFVYGANDAGVNKSLNNKLIAAIVLNSKYQEIEDPHAFYKELASEASANQIILAAKRQKADFVYIVSMIEAFGAYSISANIIKTVDSQVVKKLQFDRSLKSLDDLTSVSKQLAAVFISIPASIKFKPQEADSLAAPADSVPVAQAAFAAEVEPVAVVVPAPAQCENTYNINELLFKIQNAFPTQLKECGTTLAKDMALAASPFGKKPAPEPKSFMTQCAIDGIKTKLPADFPGVDKVIGDIQGFVNSILNTAMAGASLDPKKLLSAIGDMKIDDLLGGIKKLGAENACIVDKPYTPPAPAASASKSREKDANDEDEEDGAFTFGFRGGMNFSWLAGTFNNGYRSGSGSYESLLGMQVGLAFDFAVSEEFHIQPGLLYVQKGLFDESEYWSTSVSSHYLEIPVLVSLKFSAFRINAGPYFGICLATNLNEESRTGYYGDNPNGPSHSDFDNNDFGISMGLGFDIGSVYLGLFYDHGFVDVYSGRYFEYYNRTVGLNFGVNL